MKNDQIQIPKLNLEQSVKAFGDSLRERGKQPATVDSYRRDAARFVEYLSENSITPGDVSPEILVAYQDYLSHTCQERENTVRRAVIGVRQFYRYLAATSHASNSPLDAVSIPPRDESLAKVLDDDEVEDVVAVAGAGSPPSKAARDVALVGLLAWEGLKATESIGLLWSDLIDSGGKHASLHIGGNRERVINLEERTRENLRNWRDHYHRHLKTALGSKERGRMFVSFKGRDAGTLLPEITRHGLKFIMYELGEKSGINHLNTESLRHFAVNRQLALGRSPEDIMRHLGLRRLGNIAKHMGTQTNLDV